MSIESRTAEGNRPELVGQREKNVECSVDGCMLRFAEKKMYRHASLCHSTKGEPVGDRLPCPAVKCNETFKQRDGGKGMSM